MEEAVLPNGLKVLYLPDSRLPLVSLRVLGRGGPGWDPAGGSGMSELVATLLTKDAGGRSAEEVAHAIDSMGARFRGQAGNNTFGLSLEALRTDLDEALSILGAAVCEPEWRESTFERERSAQSGALREMLDDIVTQARVFARASFFGAHPFGRIPEGTLPDLQGLALSSVKEQGARLLSASNLCLVVAGDVDPARDHEKIASAFAGLSAGSALADLDIWQGYAGPAALSLPVDRQQSIVLRYFADRGFKDEQNDALMVLNTYLSGMSSPLFQRVREEKGMAYFVGAQRLSASDFGAFIFYAGTQREQVAAVLNEFDREMESVSGQVLDPAVFQRTVTQLKAQHQMSMQRPEVRSLQAAICLLYNQPLSRWWDFNARLNAVTPESVRRVAAEVLDPRRTPLTVIAGQIPEGY